MAKFILVDLEEERKQGDDEGPSVDFFTPIVQVSKLDPAFHQLTNEERFSPALEIIRPMMRWYEDVDGNFVEQFQTKGFHPRIWELYLFAALTEAGYVFDRTHPAPDFTVQGVLGGFCIEATTVNPSQDSSGNPLPPPATDTPEAESAYMREYVPVRYAGALTTKLNKKYWEHPHVANMLLVFAIQDFHAPMSMTWSRSGLTIYLYGYDHDVSQSGDGELTIIPRKVEKHRWGNKVIPSGFFDLPDAENISAVIFNSSATISKFSRTGLIAGFGSKRVRMIREGTMMDHDPNASEPKFFRVEVLPDTYNESWVEGMDVFHNPRARYPLDPNLLAGAAHHRLLDSGLVVSNVPKWHAFASVTHMFLNDAGE